MYALVPVVCIVLIRESGACLGGHSNAVVSSEWHCLSVCTYLLVYYHVVGIEGSPPCMQYVQ